MSVDPGVAEVLARTLEAAGVEARAVGRVGARADEDHLVSVV